MDGMDTNDDVGEREMGTSPWHGRERGATDGHETRCPENVCVLGLSRRQAKVRRAARSVLSGRNDSQPASLFPSVPPRSHDHIAQPPKQQTN